MSESRQDAYRVRIQKVIEYIEAHLDGALSLDRLSQVAGFSKYHFRRTFGIVYDDPDATAPEDFRFDIAGELRRPIEENRYGIVEKQIPGGKVAVVRHVGTLDTIGSVVRKMYGSWLPQSGEELRDFPCFFHYVKRMPQVSEHEQITDIYLPLH